MAVVEVIGEDGQVFGGPEQHLGRVVERTLDGGELSCDELLGSCVPADRICVESYDDGVCGSLGCTVPVYTATPTGAVSRRAGPVPLSADDLELAELRLR